MRNSSRVKTHGETEWTQLIGQKLVTWARSMKIRIINWKDGRIDLGMANAYGQETDPIDNQTNERIYHIIKQLIYCLDKTDNDILQYLFLQKESKTCF